MFTTTKARLAAAALAAATLGTAALAAPASASSCGTAGSNCATASISIPQSFTFSEATQAVTFTGTPGGPSNVVTVSYSTTTNDPAGYIVQMSATGSQMTDGTSVTIPVSDVAVWGPAQNSAAGTAGCNVSGGVSGAGTPVSGCYFPEAVSTTPLTTDKSTTYSAAGGDSAQDSYAFLGSGFSYSPAAGPFAGQTATGSNIPGNVPAGTYSDGLQYVALAS